jgi:cysteine desulfurase / selenocysteine lyase
MIAISSIGSHTVHHTSYANDFGPFDGRAWLNTAHQGAVPRIAAEAARTAISHKTRPDLIRNEDFFEVPVRLRAALGRLIGANADDIILGNSTTYGLDLLANGLRWRSGDEVLLVDGDYPANIFPWLVLRDQGVSVRFVKSTTPVIPPEQLAREISPRTRLFCASWVNPFTGAAIDPAGVGQVCRDHDVLFVLNASQALGARVIDVRSAPIDALTCSGSKWLCGPYGTGFCWLTPHLRESLIPRHAYWLAMIAGRPLDQLRDYSLRTDLGARAWDVFCTANFFSFIPWTASIEYLLAAGPARIAGHDDRLVAQLLQSVDDSRFQVVSPLKPPRRSTIVILQLRKGGDVSAWFERLTSLGLDIAVGEGTIRISPHLHNTSGDIERLVQALST